MPGMNGADIARVARSTRPGMPILFVTGYADRAALAGVDEAHIIGKPYLDDELTTKIRLALREERAPETSLVDPATRGEDASGSRSRMTHYE